MENKKEVLAKLEIANKALVKQGDQFFRDVSPLLHEIEQALIDDGYVGLLLCDGVMMSRIDGKGEYKLHTIRSYNGTELFVDRLLPETFNTDGERRQTLMNVQGFLVLLETGWLDKVYAHNPAYWGRRR